MNSQPLGDNVYRVSGARMTVRYAEPEDNDKPFGEYTGVYPQVFTIDLPAHSVSPRLWKILIGKRMSIISQMKYYAHRIKRAIWK